MSQQLKNYPRALLALVISSVFLSACNDDNTSASATPITATLKSPRVTNLVYQGNQGSTGRTNEAGEYTCKSGETISFNLGKTAIGTTTCQAGDTSLMQMVGGGLTTQNALQEMQRAGGTLEVLPYDQWINRLSLLAELDSNANLSDGIQLPTGLDKLAALNTTSLDFKQDHSVFGSQLAQVYYPSVGAGLYQRPLLKASQGELIKGLEAESAGSLKFPAYVPLKKTLNSTNDSFAYTWDAQGLLQQISTANGIESATFDTQGRYQLVTSPSSTGGKIELSLVWNNQNQLTSMVQTTYDKAGTKTNIMSDNKVYDANGYTIQHNVTNADLSTKTTQSTKSTMTYTNQGQVQQVIETITTEVNGVVDATKTTLVTIDSTYDAKGNLSTLTKQITNSEGGFVSKELTQFIYNNLGAIVERTYQDLDMNGNSKSSNKLTNSYTADSYLSGATRVYQNNNQVIGSYKDVYQYGTNGHLIRKVRAHYNAAYNNANKPVRTFDLNLTYNALGLRTESKEQTTQYQDGQGVTLSTPTVNTVTKQWVYDANQNPISQQIDSNGDGIFETKTQWTWQAVASIGNAVLIDQYKADTLAETYSTDSASEDGWEVALMPKPPLQLWGAIVWGLVGFAAIIYVLM
ncbi:hypothetical protein [Thiolinea disciformis]|uniref:hypothetical protein n=1 Tax=Thiolinea disciformis TaxID=125614 RepID=UPI00036FD233|nr:hypothetical protein [Thiolinea disciformis]